MIELEQYRDKWLAENVDDYIGFYNREFFCLDNFSSFGIEYKGKYYATIEHAYQAGKFFVTAPKIAEEIRLSTSAYKTKKLAQENADKVDSKFDEYKISFMEELIRFKVEQHPYVLKKLLKTKDYTICEDSPKDAFGELAKNVTA